MTLKNIRLKYVLMIVIACSATKLYAGGFPVRPGSLSISPSVTYFFANKGWDSLSRKSAFAQNGQFSSISYSLYAEYGISKRFTFTATLPYAVNNFQQDNYKNAATGLTDLETGIRYYLANINYTYYFTIQGTFITPLYTDLSLGYKEKGAEFKASFAGSGRFLGQNYYFLVEDGVRQYFGTSGPIQNRYNTTFGITLDRKFKSQIAISAGGFYSASSFTKSSLNQAVNKNFYFNQASLSYGYSFSKRFSAFASVGTFINGRNTGDGSSSSIAFIIRPF